MREESSTMRLHNENNEPWSKLVRTKGKTYRHVQFYQWSDPEALIKIHLSVIRPHLEYAAPVWSPDLINKLEHVQKFALRVCIKQWNVFKSILALVCAWNRLALPMIALSPGPFLRALQSQTLQFVAN